jgi:diadenosine tetraphosphate (Ap4A) HIT family hydrolase
VRMLEPALLQQRPPDRSATSGRAHSCSQACLLCGELTDRFALSNRLGLYASRDEKILLESSDFLLIPDLSPLSPGHSLVITREHYRSFASLPSSMFDDLEHLRVEARARIHAIASVNGACRAIVMFEHGGPALSDQPGGGACIEHAHLHFFPVSTGVAPLPLRDWLEEYGDVHDAPTWADVVRITAGGKLGYLLCEDEDGRGILATDFVEPLPSQYMRRRLAKHLGISTWNWKAALLRPASNFAITEAVR